MGDIKNAPDVPDPVETAGYQTGTNIGTAKANAKFGYVGTSTPYGETKLKRKGSTKYTDPYTGETYKIPKFVEKVKLTEEGQKQFDLQQGTQTNLLNLTNKLSGQMGDYLSTPFSLGQFDFGADLGVDAYQPGESLDGQVYSGAPLTLGNEATEARLFELGSKRLDPKFARDRENLQASLLSRGIREGTAAWDAAMGNFNQGENDAYNNLLLTGRGQAANEMMAEWQAGLQGQGQTFDQLVKSRGLGMAEQGQQFTQSLADRQRLLAEREQQTGEAFATRSQPINEIAALLGTGGQVNMPQLTGYSTTQIPTMDVAGLINDNWDKQFQAWQAESAATQGMLGGLFGAVGNVFASDERIKEKGDVVGTTAEGLPIYEFKVGDGETQTGVMAQDVEQQNPEAVLDTPSGIKAVDYAQAVGAGDGMYTVIPGDNLTKISKRFNTPLAEIAAANPQITDLDRIMPGDQITVPGLAAPGPEAIPYDPLSSAFVPPADGSGLPAVIEALQPAGGARPELPAGPMPGAPGMSAEMGGAPQLSPPRYTPETLPPLDSDLYGPGNQLGANRYNAALQKAADQKVFEDAASVNQATDMGDYRQQMERYIPEYRAPSPPAPPPGIDFDMAQPAPTFTYGPPPSAAGPTGNVVAPDMDGGAGRQSFIRDNYAPTPMDSTTGTWDDLPDPTPPAAVDPMADRVSGAFDVPAGQAEIMDLLAAFQNRQMMPPIPFGGMMRAGMGGF